ncbi:nucleoside 2-deoxyribosyltransferase [Eisenbergiella sp.]
MKFYIASGLKNYKQVRDLSYLLKKAGWEHTYDWTLLCPAQETETETLRTIGEMEYNGIKQSDVVIILTPEGRGTHTEFGIAIALNKKVYLCHHDDTYFKCDDNTSTFYWLPQVIQLIGNTEDIANRLLKQC